MNCAKCTDVECKNFGKNVNAKSCNYYTEAESGKYIEVTTYKEAKKILMLKGVKVAISVCSGLEYVFAEKSDFLNILRLREKKGYTKFLNYDGEISHQNYYPEEKVLYIDGAI